MENEVYVIKLIKELLKNIISYKNFEINIILIPVLKFLVRISQILWEIQQYIEVEDGNNLMYFMIKTCKILKVLEVI